MNKTKPDVTSDKELTVLIDYLNEKAEVVIGTEIRLLEEKKDEQRSYSTNKSAT